MMLGRMQGMTMGDLGMMRGFFMITGLVVLCGFAMMFGSVLVVVRRVFVVFVNIVICHGALPEFGQRCARTIASFDEPFATRGPKRAQRADEISRSGSAASPRLLAKRTSSRRSNVTTLFQSLNCGWRSSRALGYQGLSARSRIQRKSAA
jgi:hypothetical protein